MKTEGVKCKGYTKLYKVYEAGVDFDADDDLVSIKTLDSYQLHAGYGLWLVEATHKKEMKTQFYHVAAVNSVTAVNKFLTTYPWLSYIRSVKLLNAEDTDVVLNNPMRYPLW